MNRYHTAKKKSNLRDDLKQIAPVVLLLVFSVIGGLVASAGDSYHQRSDQIQVVRGEVLEYKLADCCDRIQPAADKDWRLDSLGLTMKWIPPGDFFLGSTQEERSWAADPDGGKGEAAWATDESDPLEVRIAQGFWIGQTTITRGMYRQFVEAVNYQTKAEKDGVSRIFNIRTNLWEDATGVSWRNPGYVQNDDHPVVFVSWKDAMAFCDWLTRRERAMNRVPVGYEYRLPGEAEWAYAARGGSETHTYFWWGDDFNEGKGRLNAAGADQMADESRWINGYDWEDGFIYTSPVDYYGAPGRNDYGLADMLGNVWEWCYDGYDPAQARAAIWQDDAKMRILRGGSYMRTPGSLRVANRGRGGIDGPRPHRGFRVVLAPAVETSL